MGFNRGNFLSALAGLIIGVLLVSVLPAAAGNGDIMYVGEKNTAIRATKLTSRGGLVLKTGSVGRTVLTLEVTPGTPPMQVNSTGLVGNLNADLLDGMEAAEFAASADVRPFFVTVGQGSTTTLMAKGDLALQYSCDPAAGPMLRWTYAGSGAWRFGTVSTASATATILVPGDVETHLLTGVMEKLSAADPSTGDMIMLSPISAVGMGSSYDCYAWGTVTGTDG